MATKENEAILELRDVTVHYGLVKALSEVRMDVKKGEIVAILGPNAAGKSTLMYALAGIVPITNGTIMFNGRSIHNLAAEQIVRLGLSLVPEGRLLFAGMKTLENLELGAYRWRGRETKGEGKRSLSSVFRLFPVLEERKRQMAGTLSGGQQQMVAIGRGLMSRPQLLLLDEPSLGLAPLLVRELMDTLAGLKERGITVLLSEQNAVAALRVADRGYVIAGGRVIMEGSRHKLLSSDTIKTAYLGGR